VQLPKIALEIRSDVVSIKVKNKPCLVREFTHTEPPALGSFTKERKIYIAEE